MYARLLARSLWESVVSHLVSSVVITSPRGAAFRRWSLIAIGGITWVVFAYSRHPFVPNSDPIPNRLDYLFRALFAADVFKHVLVGVFVFWFAYRAAAIYLDDIFELKNVRIAERFIRQSAFASQYDEIEIKDGDVAPKDQKSPIFLIGGPGKVRVYLENAALFERIGGTPHVIEPTTSKRGEGTTQDQPRSKSLLIRSRGLIGSLLRFDQSESDSKNDGAKVLASFERLRKVIDLRDQVLEISVEGRTRDGIPIRAKNMRVIFSVLRDGQDSTLTKPYPFNPEAIESLVYELSRESWTDAMAAQIKRELGAFIARHTLSEFLAAIGRPEMEQATKIAAEVQVEADRLSGIDESFEIDVPDPPPFVPRPGISDLFYDYSDFVARARKKGVALRWIGLGTWAFPTDIIPERHLQAWRISYENLARGSEAAIATISEKSRVEHLSAILQDTPIGIFNQIDKNENSMQKMNMVTLVNGYRGKLHTALELYDRRDESDSPEARRVRDVWTHLAHVVAHYAGDI
ncbi:MAG: hypothetical protein IMY85_07775 [Chloroflexi bacterium]|nr:hypothetical protein [Chloroflexota bacterium]